MEKIAFTPIKLRNQRPTDIKECYIELHEEHLRYRIEFYANEPNDENDHDLGWTEGIYNYFDITARKEKIAGIQMSMTSDKKWAIYIQVSGFANDIKIYYRLKENALEMHNKLNQWLFG